MTQPLARFKQFTAPTTQRRQATLRRSVVIGAVMEAVEARILLSDVPWQQTGEQAIGTLKDLNGNVMGSATLENGLLPINGTADGEEVMLGMFYNGATDLVGRVRVSITRVTPAHTYFRGQYFYDRAAIKGIVVNAGDGNDYIDFLSFRRALDVPTTLNGGAGNDDIEGNSVAWSEDDPMKVVDTTDVGTTIHGGAGNDLIHASKSPADLFDAGDGDDVIETVAPTILNLDGQILPSSGNDILRVWSNYGHTDIPLNPPPAQPEVDVQDTGKTADTTTADPVASELDATSPASAPTPAPTLVFSSNSIFLTDSKLWDT